MRMKVGVVGDLHFSAKNYKEMGEALNLAKDVLIKEGCRLVIQVGDVFDFYNISAGQTSVATIVKAAQRPFSEMIKHGMDVVIIEGNHDKSIRGTQGDHHFSSIDLLAERINRGSATAPDIRGVYPITKACLFRPVSLEGYPFSIYCLPWQTEDERAGLDDLIPFFRGGSEGHFCILAAHALQEGAKHFGREISHAEFMISNEQIAQFGCQVNAFGHVHHRQLNYAGIIMQNSLSDAGAPTGVRILDVDISEQKIYSDKFIELRTPQWKLIEVNSADPETINDVISSQVNETDHFVIRVLDKRVSQITAPANVRVEYKPPLEIVVRSEVDHQQAERMGEVDWFELWAKKNEYSEEEMDHGRKVLENLGVR